MFEKVRESEVVGGLKHGKEKFNSCFFACHGWTLRVRTGPELVLQQKWEVIAALLFYSHLDSWPASQRDITRESSSQLSLNAVRILLFWGMTNIPLNLCLIRSSSWWISRRIAFSSHRIELDICPYFGRFKTGLVLTGFRKKYFLSHSLSYLIRKIANIV